MLATRFMSLIFAVTLMVLGTAPLSVLAQDFEIVIGKTRVLRLGIPVTVVMLGNPTLAGLLVETPQLLFLTGQAAGETNLILLDENGRKIAEYDILVIPESERHVTVNRGVDNLSTLSCDPMCVGVANPKEASGEAMVGAAGGPSVIGDSGAPTLEDEQAAMGSKTEYSNGIIKAPTVSITTPLGN